MFHSFHFRRKKSPVKLRNETELDKLRMNDDYDRTKILKDFFAIILILVVLLLIIALAFEYCTNISFKNFVIKSIEQNISGIIFYILTLVGLTQLNKKRK